MANALSLARIALAPGIVWVALLGSGRLACLGLLVAGTTDVMDGYVSRRTTTQSPLGARLDAAADFFILVAAGASLVILHPAILLDSWVLLAATAVLYAASMSAPRRTSAKVAGALLYGFALFTLATGYYVPPLLWIAAVALAVSSLEGVVRSLVRIRAARTTIQLNAIASVARSHAPHALNEVGSSASAATSITTSATPRINTNLP